MPLMGISASEIRRRAKAGMSLRYYLPEGVAEYIQEHKLYGQEVGSEGNGGEGVGPGSLERLLEVALERGALKYGKFTLSSGKESTYYFDGRLLSLDPEGAKLISEAMLPILLQAGAEAVGGLTLGADPIVSSIALASHLQGEHIPGFIVRKEAKTHGTGQGIEGPLPPKSRVAIIDDVCTTAGSLFQAIAAVEAAGCTVVKVAAILDRKEGGSEELARRGYDFVALMSASPDGRIQVVKPK
jgi:orotate phosphoribosyltransferase